MYPAGLQTIKNHIHAARHHKLKHMTSHHSHVLDSAELMFEMHFQVVAIVAVTEKTLTST